ncbi:MAG: zinc finger MYND domain-containing protein [Chlamydiae bacterium]|nr:zinc finger MYND domain-containing protein [Chlamydiota bacterium]
MSRGICFMSTPIRSGMITITHADSNIHDQILMVAEMVWGIKPERLPTVKFHEIRSILEGHLTKEFGPYKVKGFGNAFMIHIKPEALKNSYKKKSCSLNTCMATEAAFRCAQCKSALYCSKEHQIQDWPRHKMECITHR